MVDELLGAAPDVGQLGAVFAAAGHTLAIVGGAVRDALLGRLGRAGMDWDLTTSAHPDETERLLGDWADAVWDIGRAYGTVGCPPRRAGRRDHHLPVRRLRRHVPQAGGAVRRHPGGRPVAPGLHHQRAGVDIATRRLVDPFGGRDDIARRLLRTPGTPQQSFSDDPLRMMRAARFAAQLGFTAADEVVAAMRDMADRVGSDAGVVSAERVRDELVKLICAPDPRAGLTLMVQTGLADHVLPEVPAMRLERDEHHRHKDVYEHSLTVLEQAIALEHRLDQAPDFIVRFAALMHDIGKPRTRKFQPDGTVTFHHHDVVGAKMCRKRMRALRFSGDTVTSVCHLVELHLRFHGYGSGEWTDSAVRRYVRDAGAELPRLHVLTRADCTTRNARKAARLQRTYDHLEERIARLAEQEELNSLRPDLDGNQIMAVLAVPPGRDVGEAYRYLLELRTEHGPLGEERATAELLDWWRARQAGGP